MPPLAITRTTSWSPSVLGGCRAGKLTPIRLLGRPPRVPWRGATADESTLARQVRSLRKPLHQSSGASSASGSRSSSSDATESARGFLRARRLTLLRGLLEDGDL